MKNTFGILILICLVIFSACNNNSGNAPSDSKQGESSQTTIATSEKGIVEISEKMFVTYINEIYTNTPDYIGKTIKLEGMYKAEEYEGKTYYYVYRIGPGCCGNDGSMCGFEFTYDKDMPKENDWIEATGTLRTYKENEKTFLTLDITSLKILDKRGAEKVYQ